MKLLLLIALSMLLFGCIDDSMFAKTNEWGDWGIDCHDYPVGHPGPLRLGARMRDAGKYSCECRWEQPACMPGMRVWTGKPVYVLAYTPRQAIACGKQRCRGFISTNAGFVEKPGTFVCSEKPIETFVEPEAWVSGVAAGLDLLEDVDWHLPMCRPMFAK